MNFYEFFLYESTIENLLPQKKIGSGHFADVYSTQDHNVVMRIERKKSTETCDKLMMTPEIQATGGVAKILGIKMVNKKELPDLRLTSFEEMLNEFFDEKFENSFYKKMYFEAFNKDISYKFT